MFLKPTSTALAWSDLRK